MAVTYDEFPSGFSWMQPGGMPRTSHALVTDGSVWLVDPTDAPLRVDQGRGSQCESQQFRSAATPPSLRRRRDSSDQRVPFSTPTTPRKARASASRDRGGAL